MLRLGTHTGSLFNHLDSRSVRGEPAPYVGMGATILHWTDRTAATVVKIEVIRNATYITTQDDTYVRTDDNGMSESQNYDYSPNPLGCLRVFKKNFKKHQKISFWVFCLKNPDTGRYIQHSHGDGLKIGVRDKYHDYSF